MSWNQGQILDMPVSEAEADTRLDRWLKRRFPGLTQGQVEKLLRKGDIRVDGAKAKSNTRLKAGEIVRVPPMPTGADKKNKPAARPDHIKPADADMIRKLVMYEDERMIVLNKPSGLATQGGTKTTRHVDGLAQALVPEGEDKPRLVHRLDKDTSGLLVLAKTAPAAAELAKYFRQRNMEKVYWAIVAGVPDPLEGEIRGWMKKGVEATNRKAGDIEKMRMAKHGERDAHFSITDYAVVSNAARTAAWVSLKPVTGRTHQLRLHMSSIGCAILGDNKYTCDRPSPDGVAKGLHLHARALRLPRPSGGPVELVAPVSPHMKSTFNTLGFLESEAADPFEAVQSPPRRR
ncbi:MAG: RluA family pseudouridine synthase [Pseudomonadota bacterium]